MKKSSKKTGLIVGAAVAAAFIGYEIFSKKKTAQPAVTATITPTASTSGGSSILSSLVSAVSKIINPSAPVAPAYQQQALAPVASEPVATSPATDFGPLQSEAPALQLPVDNSTASYQLPADYVGNIIGTTSQTGAVIQKISPVLAVIPVVGWIAAGAGEVVGLALNIFGNKWNSNTQVRWLCQQYQYYVLGQANVTSDNKINEAEIPNATKWFSIVTGVPIMDIYYMDRLRGVSGTTGQDYGYTDDRKASDYVFHVDPKIQPQPTLSEALAAVQIVKNYLPTVDPVTKKTLPSGSWANLTAAPALVDYSLANVVNAGTSALSSSAGPSAGTQTKSSLLPILLVGGGAAVLLSGSKEKKVSGSDSGNDLLIIAALATAGYYYYKKHQQDVIAVLPASTPANAIFSSDTNKLLPAPINSNPQTFSSPTGAAIVAPVSSQVMPVNQVKTLPINSIAQQTLYQRTQLAGIGSIGPLPAVATAAVLSGFDFGKIEWEKLVIPAAVIGGGYLVYKKFFAGGSISPQTSQNNQTIQDNQNSVASTISQLQNSGSNQTISDAQAAGIADSIWSIGSGSSLTTAQQDQIRYLVMQANTTLDLLAIIKAFGVKKINTNTFFLNLCYLFGINCQSIDLPGYLKIALSSDEISELNQYLIAQNINYQF